ncbi:MAG: M81 family metallopeptidase [Pseudomonadota bacterium]
MAAPRIAIAGFQHETNSFAPFLTDFADFEMADSWPGLLRGDAVIAKTRGLNLPIAGFAEAAATGGATLIPLLWCAAEPGGPVRQAAFDAIAEEILVGIRRAGALDGLYLDLHGAMITEQHRDGEGALLARLRTALGPDLPLVLSLDLHANVSERMVALSDAITVFRTYPHLDMAETGARAWTQLARCLREGRPAKARRKARFLVPAHAQHTEAEPARGLYRALPDTAEVSVDMALGFTAGDTPDRFPAILAYGRNQMAADAAAEAALARLDAARGVFDGRLLSADAAVAKAMAAREARPVVLADVQDNPGAGASSDTTGLLRALVASGAERALLGLVHDPALAAQAHSLGCGATFDGALGGRSGVLGDAPFCARFRVEALHDGRICYTGAMYRGGVGTLGPSCALSLPASRADLRVVVTSVRNQCLDLAHFTAFGLDPAAAWIVGVKSTAHFRAAFAPIAGRVIAVAAPGLFPCDLSSNDVPVVRPSPPVPTTGG